MPYCEFCDEEFGVSDNGSDAAIVSDDIAILIGALRAGDIYYALQKIEELKITMPDGVGYLQICDAAYKLRCPHKDTQLKIVPAPDAEALQAANLSELRKKRCA